MSVDDLFVIPAEMLYVAMSIVSVFLLLFTMDDYWAGTGYADTILFSSASLSIVSVMAQLVFVGAVVGLIGGSIFLASRINAKIYYAPIFWFMSIVAAWWSVPFAQGYEIMMNNPAISDYGVYMQAVTIMFARLPLMIIIVGGIMGVVLFFRSRESPTEVVTF